MSSIAGERVQVFLFGSFELKVNGQSIHLPTRKMEALCAYLVLHRNAQNREKLAALFWGDSADELARRSLRTALSALRKEVGESFVTTDRETIQLNPEFSMWVDVHETEQQAREILSGNHAVIDADLYRGDLLQDFYDEWVLEEREHYRKLLIKALHLSAQVLKASGEYPRAISMAQKIISIDPADEQAYQHLMFCQHVLGNRAEALKVYEECSRRLKEHVGVAPSEDTIALYEQIKNSKTGNTLSAKSNLPIPLTSFIGREQELKTLIDIFSTTRLLTLTGVGGCGKTRLSIQLARQLADQHTDGDWWLEFAAIQDETSLLLTMMKTLGIAESQIDSAEESILKFLRSRKLLLVMDNCEHVISACARLAESILSQCPEVKILATSREALSIHGEIAWLVPSLSLPPVGQTHDLMKWECPRLFYERATTYRPDLQLNEANTESFLRICRALEGIPLAIELAAARVKTLSLEQLAARLDDKLSLLTTGSRAAQPRQQTLRATIDWSYELLSEQEKIILQQLSVFYGSWTLEAAESVCADEEIGASEILDLITHLLDKSLIVSENHDGLIRYRMLEIIRQYGMEKLAKKNEVQHVKDRHARYYSELVQNLASAWYSQAQSTLIKQFDAEYPNLRVALAWGLDDPKRRVTWEYGVNLALALIPHWNFHAELNEGLGWLKKVIDQVDALLAESGTESKERSGLLSLKAKTLYEYGALSYYLTLHSARMDLFEEAAKIYKELGDERGLARPNLYIAQTAFDEGKKELAYEIWLQSLEQFDRAGDRWYAAMVHSFLGWAERKLENYDEAVNEFYRAIDLYNEIGDEWGMSIMLSHLGMTAFQRDDPEKALDFFERRLMIARKNGFKHSIAYGTFLVGISHWKSGDNIQMQNCIREALPVFQQIGNYIAIVDCAIGLAWAAAEAGQLDRAAYLLGAAEKGNQIYGRKYYFEYVFFYQPIRADLISRFDGKYGTAIEKGRNANLDEVVKDIVAE